MNRHRSFSNTRQIFYMVASELRARFLTKIAKNEITFHKKNANKVQSTVWLKLNTF